MVGQGLELAETGQQAHFEIHLVDMAGDPCTTEQQVTAELRSLVDSSITPASVAHKTPDIYEVSYQPNTQGRHKLSVVVNDVPVQGSPFLVYVRQDPHLLGRPVRVIKELNRPRMVAITSSGDLAVSEHCKISILSRDGKRIRSINTTSVRSGIRWYKLDPYVTGYGKTNHSRYFVETEINTPSESTFIADHNGTFIFSIGLSCAKL